MYIIYPLKSFFSMLFFMLAGTFLTIGLTQWLDSTAVFVIGFSVFFVTPAFYNKTFKKWFTKRIVFSFEEVGFTVDIYNLKTDELEETFFCKYQDIKSCSLSAKQTKYSALIIRLDNGKTQRFTFFDDTDDNSSEIVYSQIIAASDNLPKTRTVDLRPHFYTSKLGTRIIIAMAVVMIVLIVVELLYFHQALPISFISSAALFIVILLRRKANLKDGKIK